jgi:gliding motility-associated-like protein
MGGTFIVTIVDNCFKVDKDTITIVVQDCEVIVPNIVTANGDGVNDMLSFKNLDKYPGSTLAVFNRWGSKVYESANYNNSWVPDVNDGVYYFVLSLPDGQNFSGYFHVVTTK